MNKIKRIPILGIMLYIIALLPAQIVNEIAPRFDNVDIFIGRDISFVNANEINKSIRIFLTLKNPDSVSRVMINLKSNDGSSDEKLKTSDVLFQFKDGKVYFLYTDPFTLQERCLALKRESAMLDVSIGFLMHDAINVEVILFDKVGNEVDRKLCEIY